MNAILIIAAIAVRNPFWPIGHQGVREVISADPVVDVSAVQAPSEDETATAGAVARSSQTVSDRQWADARRSLRIGGIVVLNNPDGTRRQCVMINGLAYGDGDLVSTNHNGRRFTWRIKGLTKNDTIRLVRVRARKADTPAPKADNGKKEKTK